MFRFLPVSWEAETSFRLKIQRTCDGECFIEGRMLAADELECNVTDDVSVK